MLANRSMPRSTVIPVLGYPDVGAAVRWLCDAFGFTLRIGIGTHRAQLNVGDGAVVVMAQPLGGGTSDIMVRIDDVDRHHAHARAQGTRILRPPADYPYGERQYSVQCLGGHNWTFSQSIRDIDPPEWGGSSGHL